MSSAPGFIGLERFASPGQPERCRLQTDLLKYLKNDNFEQFACILTNYDQWIDINHLYEGPVNKTLLESACSCKGKAKFVEKLLESGAVSGLLNKLQGKAAIHLAVLYSDFDTLKSLVEYPGVDVNIHDKEGNTALHYAVQLDHRESITLLLDRGAHLGVQNSNGDLAVKFMSAETLEYLLDRCITTKSQLLEKDYQIIFDYRLLVCQQPNVEPPPVEETELLAAMSEVNELRPMLKHPVLTSFLDLKWRTMSSSRYQRLLFIHTVFSIALTGYILGTFVPLTTIQKFGNDTALPNSTCQRDTSNMTTSNIITSNTCTTTSNTTASNITKVNTCTKHAEMIKKEKAGLEACGLRWWWASVVCISFILCREVLQLVFFSKRRYCKDEENYLKVVLIIATYLTLWVGEINPESGNESKFRYVLDFRYVLAAVTIFLSYIELMLLISHHPVVSVSVHLFKTMAWNYSKLISYYAALILAFAVSFYIVFTDRTKDSYQDYTLSHVLLNITKLAFKQPPLFDDKELGHDLGREFRIQHVALAIYSFFVALVLISLLAVDSVSKASETNEAVVKFVSQARFIIDSEKSAPDLIAILATLGNCLRSFVERRLMHRQGRRYGSRRFSRALLASATGQKMVSVLVNQQNRIVTRNMKLKDAAPVVTCCGVKNDWSFSKSSVAAAKKILSERASQESSSRDKSIEKVTQMVEALQSRLLELERALNATEQKLQNVVEETVRQTSTHDRIKFECTMKSIECRLQSSVESASRSAVAEIGKILAEMVRHVKSNEDIFYST